MEAQVDLPTGGFNEMKYAIAFLLACCFLLQPADASRPVRKTIIGCVVNGIFTSDNGYVIRIRRRLSGDRVDLSPWQNRRLQITGDLLPGDNFYLVTAPVVLGPCR